jgi:hypothetical protein
MNENAPLTVICTYKVKEGKEKEMERLLGKHWPALHSLGLVTDDPPRIFRGLPSGKPGEAHGAERTFVEIFDWKNARSPQIAHETPGVMAVWEPMGAICEDMDFPHFERVNLFPKK